MILDMIEHYAALADPPGVVRADFWRISETISVLILHKKIPNVMKHE